MFLVSTPKLFPPPHQYTGEFFLFRHFNSTLVLKSLLNFNMKFQHFEKSSIKFNILNSTCWFKGVFGKIFTKHSTWIQHFQKNIYKIQHFFSTFRRNLYYYVEIKKTLQYYFITIFLFMTIYLNLKRLMFNRVNIHYLECFL